MVFGVTIGFGFIECLYLVTTYNYNSHICSHLRAHTHTQTINHCTAAPQSLMSSPGAARVWLPTADTPIAMLTSLLDGGWLTASSRSNVTTDGQSASLSCCQSPIQGL
jgi:hypothetical protein